MSWTNESSSSSSHLDGWTTWELKPIGSEVQRLGGGGLPLGTSLSCRRSQRPDLEVVEADEVEVELGVVVAAEKTEVSDFGLAAF
jgi:hypothetical protein